LAKLVSSAAFALGSTTTTCAGPREMRGRHADDAAARTRTFIRDSLLRALRPENHLRAAEERDRLAVVGRATVASHTCGRRAGFAVQASVPSRAVPRKLP
jgi:hypothetical protein